MAATPACSYDAVIVGGGHDGAGARRDGGVSVAGRNAAMAALGA